MEDNQQYQTGTGPAAPFQAPEPETKTLSSWLKACFAPQNRKKTFIALAAVVLVIIVAVCVSRRNSPASVAQRFVEACVGDTQTQYKLMAYDAQKQILYSYDDDEEEFFMDMSDYYDEDIESWRDYYKVCDEELAAGLEDEVGYDYEVTVKVTKEKNISLDKFLDENEDRLDWLEEAAEFDRDRISAAKEITVKIRLKGEDDIERETLTLTLVKVGGWKVFSGGF